MSRDVRASDRVRSRRDARRFAPRPCGVGQRASRGLRRGSLPEEVIGRMVGDGAPRWWPARSPRPARAARRCPRALSRIYNSTAPVHTRPYAGIPEVLETLQVRARLAVLTNKPLRRRSDSRGLALAGFSTPTPWWLVMEPSRASRIRPGLLHLSTRAGVRPGGNSAGRRFARGLADRPQRFGLFLPGSDMASGWRSFQFSAWSVDRSLDKPSDLLVL